MSGRRGDGDIRENFAHFRAGRDDSSDISSLRQDFRDVVLCARVAEIAAFRSLLVQP